MSLLAFAWRRVGRTAAAAGSFRASAARAVVAVTRAGAHPLTASLRASTAPALVSALVAQPAAGKKSFHAPNKKLRTHSGTKKRVRMLDGELVHWQTNLRHYNSHKRNIRLKRLRGPVPVGPEMMRHIKRSFPYGVPPSSRLSSDTPKQC